MKKDNFKHYSENKFRDSKNRYLTRSLFLERASVPEYAIYTLAKKDRDSFPSFHRLFVEFEDPTGYNFSQVHLDGYDHWKKLTTPQWFQAYLEEMLEEVDMRIYAKGISEMMKKAISGDPKALSWLVARGYIDEEQKNLNRSNRKRKPIGSLDFPASEGNWRSKGKGRPPNKNPLPLPPLIEEQVDSDFERLMNSNG